MTLSDVCESVRYGYTAPASDDEVGPRFLRITDIVRDSIDWASVPFCEIEDEDRERCSLQVGDIVVARTGATVGYAKLIREPVDAVFASYLVRFRVDDSIAVPSFIGRLVESSLYRDFVSSQVGGAAQPNANAQVLGRFTFRLPPRKEQERIASILSAYDDLIENNRRRMKLLEDAARLLYQEWFVHLRFPGHERTRIVDGVPEGWERKRLSEIAIVNRATLPANHDGDIEYIDISSVVPGEIIKTELYAFADAPGRARRVVQHGDIIWSCVRPNRRSYALIWNPAESLIVSTGFAVITPTAVPFGFLYCATTMDDFTGYLSNHVRGGAYPAVVAEDFEKATLHLPSRSLQTSFGDAVEPMLAQKHNLWLQNRRLRVARDLLLPRLMNREGTI
jgi:type I restriction enzyme S subunit